MSESESKPQPSMDYARNRLFFDPIPKKDHHAHIDKKETQLGCGPFVPIGIGLLCMLGGNVGSIAIGLIAIAIGGGWLAIIAAITASANAEIAAQNEKIDAENRAIDDYNRNRTVVTGQDLDKICADYLKSDVESMALKKLGIDKSQVMEVAPICFDGYYYKELKTSKPRIKKGSDGKERSSHYNAVMFFFSADQVYCYQLRFSLLEDKKQEATDELFYRDIVSVSTTSDTISYGSGDKKSTISFEEFTLTTSGGTKMDATIADIETAEHSIQEMRNLLRRKKQQS